MTQRTMTQTIALRLIVFFARNPEEELTSSDVVEKFGVDGENLRHSLKHSIQAGLLGYDSSGPGRGKVATYRAGDKLLQMFSSSPFAAESLQLLAEACMPLRSDFARSGLGELTTC